MIYYKRKIYYKEGKKMEYAAEAISDETSEITPNDLAGDYACIAEIIGIENTILLHKHYRGDNAVFGVFTGQHDQFHRVHGFADIAAAAPCDPAADTV